MLNISKTGLIMISIISFLTGGCFLAHIAETSEETVQKIDIKVEQIVNLYNSQKEMYLQKRKTYIELRKTIYGENGKTKIWQYLIKNEPELVMYLADLNRQLIALDAKLAEIDISLTKNYMTWQQYKSAVIEINTKIRKMDIVLEGLNLIIKNKIG